ncbi:hypothetical protein RDABS01_002569 [Bienertia sinuspersici]
MENNNDVRRNNERYYFDGVSSDVISSILARLPTKTTLNCKLVCKEWCGIIISPDFADLRSRHCSYSPIMLYRVFEERTNLMVLDIDRSNDDDAVITSVDAVVRFSPPPRLIDMTDIHYDDYTVVNECNGLVLLASWRRWDPFVICNLLTGEQVTVQQCSRPGLSVVDYGLGCCPVSGQFKVLRVLQNHNNKTSENKFVAEIQTLGSNQWRAVEGEAPLNFDTLGIGAFLESGAFLQGSLHRYSNLDNSIWSFNFSKEQFCQVPTLDDMKRGGYKCLHVFDHSFLVLTSLFKLLNQCEVWIMKEYGVKDSWLKLCVVDTLYCSPVVPMLRINSGRQILFSHHNEFYLLEACSDVADIRSWKKLMVPDDVCNAFKVMAPCHAKFTKLSI